MNVDRVVYAIQWNFNGNWQYYFSENFDYYSLVEAKTCLKSLQKNFPETKFRIVKRTYSWIDTEVTEDEAK